MGAAWAHTYVSGEYAISHGSESISLHTDDVHDVRCKDEVVTGEKMLPYITIKMLTKIF